MIFKRNSEADTALFTTFNKVGWGIMAFNVYTLFPYFYDILKGTAYWQRIFATSASIALIIGIIRHEEVVENEDYNEGVFY